MDDKSKCRGEPVVPPVWTSHQYGGKFDGLTAGQGYRLGWNDCRAAMLESVPKHAEPVKFKVGDTVRTTDDFKVVGVIKEINEGGAKAFNVVNEEAGTGGTYGIWEIEHYAEPMKVPSDDIHRDASGETWMGMRVAAWEWIVSSPLGELPHHATHWSTGPKDAERLYRESDIRALLARYGHMYRNPENIDTPDKPVQKTAESIHDAKPAVSVLLDFDQVGRAGPFPVVDGCVFVPAVTVMDIVQMVPPAASAEPVSWVDAFQRGDALRLHYHGQKRAVARVFHLRPGVICVNVDGMLPVTLPESGRYNGSAPIWLEHAPVAAQPRVPEPLKYGRERKDHYVTGWNNCRAAMLAANQAQHDDPTPILYQHTDGRYGLSLHGRPAAFTEGDPGWYRVPIDIVEPASEN